MVQHGAFNASVAQIHWPWPGRLLIHGRFRGYCHLNRRQRGRGRLWRRRLTALSLRWPHLRSVRTYGRPAEEGEGACLIYREPVQPRKPGLVLAVLPALRARFRRFGGHFSQRVEKTRISTVFLLGRGGHTPGVNHGSISGITFGRKEREGGHYICLFIRM